MKKIYHLSTCTTCQRIIKELNLGEDFEFQDIKTNKITPEQLDTLEKMAGSYESLFSRRAMKFRGMGLHNQTLTERDYRRLIIDEYTFLKRPVIVIGKQIFIGNSKLNISAAKAALEDA